jgi:hypothetical protein
MSVYLHPFLVSVQDGGDKPHVRLPFLGKDPLGNTQLGTWFCLSRICGLAFRSWPKYRMTYILLVSNIKLVPTRIFEYMLTVTQI